MIFANIEDLEKNQNEINDQFDVVKPTKANHDSQKRPRWSDQKLKRSQVVQKQS